MCRETLFFSQASIRNEAKMSQLFKVLVSTEICVLADNSDAAIQIAKQNATHEIESSSFAKSSIINSLSDLPSSWENVIPYYSANLSGECRTCRKIISETSFKKEEKTAEKTNPVIEAKKESPIRQNTNPMLPKLKFKI